MNILEIENLNVGYSNSGKILKDVCIAIDSNEIIGIVGESGSGKSTLLKSIINLLPRNASLSYDKFEFLGKSVSRFNKTDWQSIRGNEISFIFQNPSTYLNPTKKIGKQFMELIKYHSSLSKKQIENKIISTMNKVHLHDYNRILNSHVFQLSGGMKQRVAIAMAFSMEPKLILADEPTNALDVVTQAKVVNELIELKNNFDTSIIMVTHNMGCAAYISDKIMVMNDGKVVEFDTTNELLRRPKMEYTKKLLAAVPKLSEV